MFQGKERCYVFSIRLCEMAKASISHAGCILAYFKKPFKFLFIDHHSIGVSPWFFKTTVLIFSRYFCVVFKMSFFWHICLYLCKSTFSCSDRHATCAQGNHWKNIYFAYAWKLLLAPSKVVYAFLSIIQVIELSQIKVLQILYKNSCFTVSTFDVLPTVVGFSWIHLISGLICFVFKRARARQGMFSLIQGTLLRKISTGLEHFKGTKAMTREHWGNGLCEVSGLH